MISGVLRVLGMVCVASLFTATHSAFAFCPAPPAGFPANVVMAEEGEEPADPPEEEEPDCD